jgi:hypothetical protein
VSDKNDSSGCCAGSTLGRTKVETETSSEDYISQRSMGEKGEPTQGVMEKVRSSKLWDIF